MRITLVHNPKAGRGEHDAEHLLELLRRAGHTAISQSVQKENWEKILQKSADAVLAAGGDGTVGKVAHALVDRSLPLAVLPLGTANNLARALGFTDSPEAIIHRLTGATQRGFDVGLAEGPWGKRVFFEGAGAGLLAEYMEHASTHGKAHEATKGLTKEQEVEQHVVLLSQLAEHFEAQHWDIWLDGQVLSGSYLLWHAMNVRSIGPVLDLAPDADPSDGLMEFVAVTKQEHPLLTEYLLGRAETRNRPTLPALRFRHLHTHWNGPVFHIDDETWPEKPSGKTGPAAIEITVKPSALKVLSPSS